MDAVYKKYGHNDPFVLADHLHKILPEWTRVKSGRVPIEIADILKAQGKSDDEIAAIESDVSAVSRVDRHFSVRP